MDFIVLFCGLLCAAALALAYWAWRRLRLMHRAANAESPAAMPAPQVPSVPSAPGASAADDRPRANALSSDAGDPEAQIKRLAEIVRTLELTHFEALRVMGGRLDAIEESAVRLQKELIERLDSLEQRTHAPAQPTQETKPPPFV
ncbi:MAG: hypothetical protein HYT79_06410 [Elusimicrobia bacterium]|nr:hypothetical protein [Elusimicrobiota bacterium]